MKKWLWLSVVLLSCGKPLPDLAPINLDQWKADKNGCRRVREQNVSFLIDQLDKLKGLSEKDIIELLGRPDRNELYKRNQKFYYYDVDPGKACDGSLVENQQLVLRFNAMGLAKEVTIEKL
ncbi:MAG: outer membrane protein assembly factor BamE [Cyclobacteriaceae bacterium]|nr:outer membrane protein assembly factor BamE [Cyclobacteriaceae bacterium]